MSSELLRNLKPSETLGSIAKVNKLKEKGINVISFGAGEPDFPTPKPIKEEAEKALNNDFTKYTPTSGIIELRDAICQKLLKDNKIEYKPSNIVVSNGAKHSLFNICYAICPAGGEILIQKPYWVSYPDMIYAAGGVPVNVVSSSSKTFKVSATDLEKKRTDKTVAFIINSPNNPTSEVYSKDELKDIAEWALKNNVWIISDEIYEKIVFNGHEHYSIPYLCPDMKDKTFVVNGMSKAYSMTGWRIGYAAGPEDIIKKIVLFQSHTTSCPNSIAQKAAVKALDGEAKDVEGMVTAFERRKEIIFKGINEIKGLKANKPEGAFYILVDCSEILKGREISDFCNFLLDNVHILVISGNAFGIENHVRLSFATSDENIIEGLKRLAKGVELWINSL
ncbi:MAG: pyridoxal phosphate-dependent aminotransferase [Candidatus Coatesbacteria bacterium]|nr:pyridoxal phosphate-dependent aminotransferase [Candidatus Coatesbacteria bacterium]